MISSTDLAVASARINSRTNHRFGLMRLIGEYPYDGSVKPGCGSKVIARTHRGVELAEVLTVTCQNAGCGKSVTRKEMLGYIDASGTVVIAPKFDRAGAFGRVARVEIDRRSIMSRNFIDTCIYWKCTLCTSLDNLSFNLFTYFINSFAYPIFVSSHLSYFSSNFSCFDIVFKLQ